jgi:hypothetical protein
LQRDLREMVQRAPAEEDLACSEIDFKEEAVEDPPVLGATYGAEVRRGYIVRGGEESALVREQGLVLAEIAIIGYLAWSHEV